MKKNGQSTLKMTLAFIVVVLLVGGIVNIWLWSNRQIVKRQQAFNTTRIKAGTGLDAYELVWPLDKIDDKSKYVLEYKEELNRGLPEEEVFPKK